MKICFMLGGFYQNGGIGRVTSVLVNHLVDVEDMDITTLSYVQQNLPMFAIAKICKGLDVSLRYFFDTEEFRNVIL